MLCLCKYPHHPIPQFKQCGEAITEVLLQSFPPHLDPSDSHQYPNLACGTLVEAATVRSYPPLRVLAVALLMPPLSPDPTGFSSPGGKQHRSCNSHRAHTHGTWRVSAECGIELAETHQLLRKCSRTPMKGSMTKVFYSYVLAKNYTLQTNEHLATDWTGGVGGPMFA